MKAIQVKYLTCTRTLPARLKVWAEGNKPAVTSDTDNPDVHATAYASSRGWLMYNFNEDRHRSLAKGQLPNGDLVYVIVESNNI